MATEVEGGLAFYGALGWLKYNNRHNSYDKIRGFLQMTEKQPILSRLKDRVNHRAISSEVAHLALRLEDGGSKVKNVVAEMTNQAWGKSASAEWVRKSLFAAM